MDSCATVEPIYTPPREELTEETFENWVARCRNIDNLPQFSGFIQSVNNQIRTLRGAMTMLQKQGKSHYWMCKLIEHHIYLRILRITCDACQNEITGNSRFQPYDDLSGQILMNEP